MFAQVASSAWLQPSAKDPSVSSCCIASCRNEPTMSGAGTRIFLFDVDNTLLDNDRIEADIDQHLEGRYGKAGCDRFWKIFETLRNEGGFADYLGAVQRFRLQALADPGILELSSFFLDYPFLDRVYPRALEV